MFLDSSLALIYGKHLDVAKRMLDFDFLSGRSPSVAGFIDPNSRRKSLIKIPFGKSEILIPIYPNFESVETREGIDTLLNFASFRSAWSVTREALDISYIKNIVIVAEGIPEREMREIIALNEQKFHKRIIGPATAGAIAWGAFRLGNAWGSLDSIVESKIYQKGSVGFVSRSGGMSNEMYRVISRHTNGIHTGIALGGDRFVGSTFRDIVLEYEHNPEIHMIVLLGEVGSRDELEIAKLLQTHKITKPVVAYVTGSFAEKLAGEVQFGHAWAKANAHEETASFKNASLREAWATVPEDYRSLWECIGKVYKTIDPNFVYTNEIPKNIQDAIHILNSAHSTAFTSTISDERWEELTYNKKQISSYVSSWSIAQVIANLWLKRDLPENDLDILETVIILLADHWPAVSGAHNTIVTARAGKDILSSLVSGLMTIGPRFGGAIDWAARYFFEAVTSWESPEDFVKRMKHNGIIIPGIGHKVKSKFNPDSRCTLLREKAKNLQIHTVLDFALAVESLTLEKKPNLILNVDGHIAAIFLDIFREIGMNDTQISAYIDAWIFNAIFILARSIGFMWHAIDQKILGEWLYRTPWEDIYYA